MIYSFYYLIANFIFTAIFARYLGTLGVQLSLITALTISTCSTIYTLLYQIKYNIIIYYFFGNWFKIDIINISWVFEFNLINTTMIIMVFIISLIVHYYSCFYMKNDPHLIRFFYILHYLLYLWLLYV